MSLPLSGIRVLDLTRVLAGPFCTMILSDLGAEVIKVEIPGSGDDSRAFGPFLHDRSLYFLSINRCKKSVSLNLKTPRGKEILRDLAARCDVLVENFRPGVMDRFGLSYASLAEINPRLVYCAISGFGQTGPDALKPAYDQIIQGLSGVMAINGDERLNPLRAGFPVCDTVGGLNAAFAMLAALFSRERTGQGQFIDIALLDSIMPLMGWVVANLMIGGQQPVLMGNDNFTAAPSGTFETKDGFINIAANKQEQWEALADLLGLSELKTDARFRQRDERKKNRGALTPLLEERLKEHETDYWVDLFNARSIPSGAILSLEEALGQPQVLHRGTLKNIHAEGIGYLKLFNLTAQFEKTPGELRSAPPHLSEHTSEILSGLGYGEEQVAALRDAGTI